MYFTGYLNFEVNIFNFEEKPSIQSEAMRRKCSIGECEDQNRDRLVSGAMEVDVDDIH